MAPDPAQAMAWLQATRLWAASPDALKKIQEDARQVAIKTVWSDAKAARAAWSAARAVAAAAVCFWALAKAASVWSFGGNAAATTFAAAVTVS